MKRPLVLVATAYAGGLLLAETSPLQPPLPFLYGAAFLCALVALAMPRYRPWLLYALLPLVAWANLQSRTAVLSPHDLRLVVAHQPTIAHVRGHLRATPEHRTFAQGDRQNPRTLARIAVEALSTNGFTWHPAYGDIMAVTPGWLPRGFYGGHTVQLEGVLGRPPPPRAEGLLDYPAFLRRQGIHFQLRVASTNDWRPAPDSQIDPQAPTLSAPPSARPPLSEWFLEWAQRTMARGLPEEDDALRLLWAMTLGWQARLTNDVYEPFVLSGTMHIFAISGLHIALIAGMLVSLLRFLRLPRGWCGLVSIPLLWFYTGATGWQPSAIRATIMMTLIVGGWSLQRPTDLLNSLAAAAFIILLWDPEQLFGAGFQLSFFVVLSIALLVPRFNQRLDEWFRHDPLLPDDLEPWWRRRLRGVGRGVAGALGVSVAAWLGSLPLIAHYFHVFGWVTVFVNLLVVPLSGLALAANLGSLLCGAWCGLVTEWLNHSAWLWMKLMMWLSERACEVPAGFCFVRGPSVIQVAMFYAALLGIASGWLLALAPRRRWLAVAAAGTAGFVWFGQWYTERQAAFLAILPMEGGSSIVWRGPRGEGTWVVDTGRTNDVDSLLKPYLRGQGVNRLHTLFLTHGDIQHVGGAERLSALLPVERVCASNLRFRSAVYRQTLERLAMDGRKLRVVDRTERLDLWHVLHPDPGAGDRFTRADDGALVLTGRLNGTRVLLLSDLGPEGQRVMLERATDLSSDIVVCGLPSVGEPLSQPLLEAIRPRLIVVCDSEFPASNRASAKLKERLARHGARVVYTRETGAVTFEFRKSGFSVRTAGG